MIDREELILKAKFAQMWKGFSEASQ